ncbi:MAG: CARDB domain-containing protein [Solirubrobacteraceae bacterium]
MRRAVAAGALLVVILLIVLGVHSCQASATTNALESYAESVNSLITRSNSNSAQLFAVLTNNSGSSATTIQNAVDQAEKTAAGILSDAQSQSVPDQVSTANENLVMALKMRVDGITGIANDIQPALANSSDSNDALTDIARQMARFYASDVLYKLYAAPEMVAALHADGIAVGGQNGEPVNPNQFLPDVQWLTQSFIQTQLHATVPGSSPSTKLAPGTHGHALDSVSVAGTSLQTGSTNTIPAKPAPTFTLNFANSGTNNETDVVCKVTVNGTGVSGTTTVPETDAGKPATCQVTLSSTPPTGTYTVEATIEPVPGETNLANNSLSYPVTFQ